jgi:hypothetical protein
MRTSSVPALSLLPLLISAALLAGCGGGGSSAPAASAPAAPVQTAGNTVSPVVPEAAAPVVTPVVPPVVTPVVPPVVPPVVAPVVPAGATPVAGTPITTVTLQSTASTGSQVNVPITFGQVFAPGHVAAGHTVAAQLADGSMLPLQVDAKARHADGSLRHAILSANLGQLGVGQNTVLTLSAVAAGAHSAAVTPQALLAAGFSASVNVDVGGQRYSASADSLLRSGNYKTWLSGAVSNEWLVAAPLTSAQGAVHPHLSARFAIRAASGTQRARVDVTIENAWAFEAAPQNILYDADILVGGQSVYSKRALNHLHHARWRKVFWWGGEPAVHVKHQVAYLIATRAVPNFDQSVTFTDAQLNAWKTDLTAAKSEPMAVGLANPYMPAPGGRDDIGLLPGWAATYLLSMDKRAKDATMTTADLAGSWSSHYRDKNTDRPVSVIDYPYMTILGNPGDTMNPVTKKRESFPLCASATACDTPNRHDTSHQAAFAYLPYLVTGDYYYLEELQFWTMYNVFSSNPGYRQGARALFKPDQVRGQAWSMRTLAEAAYITPDADPFKQQFEGFMASNLAWYDENYTNNRAANVFGALTHGYGVVYDDGTGMAPWMDDFFTSAIGHAVELGFTQAKPLLAWKVKLPIMRMVDPEFCWIKGGIYTLKIRDSETSPFYTSIGQAYRASNTAEFNALACNSSAMAASLELKVGEMTGYSAVHTGFPSNMQPALAYAADVGGTAGKSAWTVFANRTVKPKYGNGPQFAIVPR